MHLISRRVVLLLSLAVGFCTSAFASEPDQRELDRLIHLPGIAGARSLDRQFVAGLHDGGYEGKSEIYDWTAGDPGIGALLARKRNEKQADLIAKRIEKLLTDDPDLKIRLVGHSGGAGIATWALERLPDDMQIETLVFVAPALSQRYDLSKALSHVRGKLYAFTSENDAIVLGAGTRVLGTIDGVKEEASGKVGFTKPDGADDEQYEKLVPMPYTADWMDFDNIGDHIGPMMRTFAREVISPIVQGQTPPSSATTTRPTVHDDAEVSETPEPRGTAASEEGASPDPSGPATGVAGEPARR